MTVPDWSSTLWLAAAGFSALTSVVLVPASLARTQPSAASAFFALRVASQEAKPLEGSRIHLSSRHLSLAGVRRCCARYLGPIVFESVVGTNEPVEFSTVIHYPVAFRATILPTE